MVDVKSDGSFTPVATYFAYILWKYIQKGSCLEVICGKAPCNLPSGGYQSFLVYKFDFNFLCWNKS